jgi:hypothetical protein
MSSSDLEESPPAHAQKRLRDVEWLTVPDDIAHALWQLTVVACRGARERCFCGCHTTTVTDYGRPIKEPKP